jgi:short-subunit dehydrogenase
VNSATWASFGEVEWVPFDVYKQATDVNLLSVIRITQVFLPLVRKTKGWYESMMQFPLKCFVV